MSRACDAWRGEPWGKVGDWQDELEAELEERRRRGSLLNILVLDVEGDDRESADSGR